MKKFFIVILIFLVVTAVLYISLFVLINVKGKEVLSSQLEEITGKRPQIGSLSLYFPLTLKITDFNLDDISFREALVSLGGFNPFRRYLVLSQVRCDGLKLKIFRNKERLAIEPLYSQKFSSQTAQSQPSEPVKSPPRPKKQKKEAEEKYNYRLKIKHFNLNDSTISYIDQSGSRKIDLTLVDFDISITDFYYPRLSRFGLSLESSLKTETDVLEDIVSIQGWIDYYRKKMNLVLKVDSFPYQDFSSLYPEAWRPKNLGLVQAYISLDSDLEAENNNLTADNVLTLDKIEFVQIDEDSQKELSRQKLVKTIIALLRGDKDKAELRFKLKTKMDSPQLKFDSIGKSLMSSLPISPKFITGQIIQKTSDTAKKGAAKVKDVTEGTIDTAVDTIKNAVGALKDIFTAP